EHLRAAAARRGRLRVAVEPARFPRAGRGARERDPRGGAVARRAWARGGGRVARGGVARGFDTPPTASYSTSGSGAPAASYSTSGVGPPAERSAEGGPPAGEQLLLGVDVLGTDDAVVGHEV